MEAFKQKGVDFVVKENLADLVAGMNALTDEPRLDFKQIESEIIARDRELTNSFSKDMQIIALRGSRNYLGDKLIRTAKPHRILDASAGPLIAVRLNILTRKTLGGLQTNLDAQVIGADGQPVQGLYAAGEVAGFGGGGMHGYAALEGTFLGGCIFSGRTAGTRDCKCNCVKDFPVYQEITEKTGTLTGILGVRKFHINSGFSPMWFVNG